MHEGTGTVGRIVEQAPQVFRERRVDVAQIRLALFHVERTQGLRGLHGVAAREQQRRARGGLFGEQGVRGMKGELATHVQQERVGHLAEHGEGAARRECARPGRRGGRGAARGGAGGGRDGGGGGGRGSAS